MKWLMHLFAKSFTIFGRDIEKMSHCTITKNTVFTLCTFLLLC